MKTKWIFLLTAAALIVNLSGCASTTQPFAYHDDRDEKPGPGLFSGDEGGFVIYGQTSENADATKEQLPKADPQ